MISGIKKRSRYLGATLAVTTEGLIVLEFLQATPDTALKFLSASAVNRRAGFESTNEVCSRRVCHGYLAFWLILCQLVKRVRNQHRVAKLVGVVFAQIEFGRESFQFRVR